MEAVPTSMHWVNVEERALPMQIVTVYVMTRTIALVKQMRAEFAMAPVPFTSAGAMIFLQEIAIALETVRSLDTIAKATASRIRITTAFVMSSKSRGAPML
jgi:NAD(P)H-dependent flavin oxidoreductase YrpB (nitropropane dioxygenase family)